mgnify:CR=1 FL=1
MSKVKMISPAVPNIPWQEKPADLKGAPIWRYTENPIIDRNPVEGVARIFNSAVMPYGDRFVGVFRGEQVNGVPYIYLGWSEDAIHWDIEPEKIPFVDEQGEPFMPVYAYDPRLVKVEDTYYIIWCTDFFGAAIGIPNFFSSKFLLLSLADLPAVVVFPSFSIATMLVASLAGVLFFKERLEKRQWFAVLFIILALLLLNI